MEGHDRLRYKAWHQMMMMSPHGSSSLQQHLFIYVTLIGFDPCLLGFDPCLLSN